MTDSAGERPVLPLSLFDYHLPEELIAQQPLQERSASRLLVLHRRTGAIEHSQFSRIGDWLRAGDLLVLNDTRVFPARLEARRETGGRVEILLLEQVEGDIWRAMARPARRLRAGERLILLDQSGNDSEMCGAVGEKSEDGTLTLELPDFAAAIAELGRTPLPHYITETLEDPDRYQTVFARHSGSVAAPTAGLHFTDEIIADLEDHEVETAWVTLHVGPGTFQPVKVEDASQHVMHSERYHVSSETLARIRKALEEDRRVIAVGTTSCRTLESIAGNLNESGPLSGETGLYITPGFKFRIVGGLLTNFHLPRSTLLLLVSAFAGREPVLRAYEQAIAERYRFYSFGDAMLIM